MKAEKTNVMRILEQHKIPYTAHPYATEQLDAVHAADSIGIPHDRLFKTLVTVSDKRQYLVFLIPSDGTLHLKKAAKAAGVKALSMLPQKELLPLTGYIHGGCSPIGMKKLFPTFVDKRAMSYDTVFFSSGKIGYMVEVFPTVLSELVKAVFCDGLTE